MRALIILGLALVAAPVRADDWPRAAIDRPLTLDRGLVEADVAAHFARRRVLGLRLDDGELLVGVRWGAGERIELDAATSVVSDATGRAWSGLVRARVAWRRVRTARLDVAPTARLDGCAACGFSIFTTAAIGAPLRWRSSARTYLHAGRELLPWTIRPYLALDLSVRAGAGAQLTPWLAAEIDAELARVTLVGQARDDRWLAHAPVQVSAIASVAPRVDISLALADDRAFDPAAGWRAMLTIAGRNR
jgi:hypothetical protein